MNIEEFNSAINGLQTAYNKTINENDIRFWYRYFKTYKFKTLMKAIDDIITNNDKMPTLKELKDKCDLWKFRISLDEEYERLPKITEKDRQEFNEILASFK